MSQVGEPKNHARSFSDDLYLLAGILGDVIAETAGAEAFALEEKVRTGAKALRRGDESAGADLDSLIHNADTDELRMLIRAFTNYFQLNNLVEDNERIRRIRRREAANPEEPRRGSILETVAALARRGVTAAQMQVMLNSADVRFVMTAHPTEARRRTIIDKLSRIFSTIRDMDERQALPREVQRARVMTASTIAGLWSSNELRITRPTVQDELRATLVYFSSSLAPVMCDIYRDLEEALAQLYPNVGITVPSFIRFGSWIGGDRDGNPYVTPDVTVEALEMMRSAALDMFYDRLRWLAGRVSVHNQTVAPTSALDDIINDYGVMFPELHRFLGENNKGEPYRHALTLMRERLAAARDRSPHGYAAASELLHDLKRVEKALREQSLTRIVTGDLQDMIRLVDVFGFSLATLDIRDHAGRHHATVDWMFRAAGIEQDYASLTLSDQAALLTQYIEDPRPLVFQHGDDLPEPAAEVLRTFRRVRRMLEDDHPGAIDTWIISNSESPADILEVLLLMKETGLASPGGGEARLRITPLFEERQSLQKSAETMRVLLDTPCYLRALKSSGGVQEVMVGYSDSNKDAGYFASSWELYRAQQRLGALFTGRGVDFLFFHGRGGAVGRGGGPTNKAILALPRDTIHGRIKVTEQGEVISTRYANREIAHREIELAVGAIMAKSFPIRDWDGGETTEEETARFEATMEQMSTASADAYRSLVYDDPDFMTFFSQTTPIDAISRLQFGSRPARRSATNDIRQLRAIPWVFSWTQCRIILPGWYGLGTALKSAVEDVGLEQLQRYWDQNPFFHSTLSNAEMAIAKADPGIARRYIELVDDVELRDRIWATILEEYELTVRLVLAVTGEANLHDRDPRLQRTFERRNPYVDPLSLIQVELLRRWRANPADEYLMETLHLAINGIAGGLRNTG